MTQEVKKQEAQPCPVDMHNGIPDCADKFGWFTMAAVIIVFAVWAGFLVYYQTV